MTDFELFLNNAELQKEIDSDNDLHDLAIFSGENVAQSLGWDVLNSNEEASSMYFNSMEGCGLVSEETIERMRVLIKKHLGINLI